MGIFSSRWVRRRVIVVVWILGMALAAALIARRPSSQIRGLAWAEPVVLTAPTDGRLTELTVSLHQSVADGAPLARFDATVLEARRQVLLAEIEALTEDEVTDRRGRDRLFERDREEASLELAQLAARVREGEARLEALHEQRTVDERLVAEGVAPQERALAAGREIKVAEARLAADRERLALARRGANQASGRAASAPGTNPWQIEAARRELGEIETRIERLSVQASIAGQVTEIYRSPGEWLRAGDPVLRISPLAAREVHAWLDSSAVDRPSPGAKAQIRRSGSQRLGGTVRSLGVERLQLPRSLWARLDAPEWGYLMRVEVLDGELAPGEPVQVDLWR